MHPAQLPIDELLKDCAVRRQRRGGPGGQHRNKVSTAVIVEHLPTGLRGEANETRSQDTNRQTAIQRLRARLALEVRSPGGHAENFDGPSEFWKNRPGGAIDASVDHLDFPSLLAEALDRLHHRAWRVPEAASDLRVTSSALIRFLKQESAAFAQVNQARRSMGLGSLR